jgi:hypothetical protein
MWIIQDSEDMDLVDLIFKLVGVTWVGRLCQESKAKDERTLKKTG